MNKNQKVNIQGIDIVFYTENKEDFISLTDIARHRDNERSDYILQNWMRNRRPLSLLVFGKNSITQILIPSNSMELKILLASTVFRSHQRDGLKQPMPLE